MTQNVNYVKLKGKIKSIRDNKDYVVVRLKIWKKILKDFNDKVFIDCFFYNYTKYKILDDNNYKKGDLVIVQGSIDKEKELIINGSHIKKTI